MSASIPKVSIVIPFFNAAATLERAVRSILQQSYADLELILVNNNSSDGSEEIAISLQREDERILLLNETRQGVTFAANTGNRAARGTYIGRMDADDFSHPDRLMKQLDLLEKNLHIGVASCLVKHVGHREGTKGLKRYVDWVNSVQSPRQVRENCFIEAPVINPTVLFRRELLDEVGGYRHGDFPEDYEMYLRWIAAGVNIQKVPEVLFSWYDSDQRLTRTDSRYRTEAFYRIKTDYLSRWLLENDHPYIWVWGAGRLSRQRASMLMEKGIWIEGYIDVKERKLVDACCIHFEAFNWDAPAFILSYVGNWGAREKIRAFLTGIGKTEGRDFILMA